MYPPNLKRFEHSYLKMWCFEPYGVSDIATSLLHVTKTPKCIFTYTNGVACCVKNSNPMASIFWKIYQFDLDADAIYIYLWGRDSEKGLSAYYKNFQEGTSKLTHAIKMYA